MTTVIGVRFKTGSRIYYFDPAGAEITKDDSVIVETARGVEFAEVAEVPHEVENNLVVQPLKPIVRVATAEDRRKRTENAAKEADAFVIGEKKIKAHGLDMKLASVEYAFDGSKVIFYFTADERVDFRELVRDLASQFRTRIELRQIGVRDEAKMLGGLGPCGRPVCCKSFLDDFRPVSIKMAKEQSLSLSPTKISGLCGRLMCCLQYEQSAYEDARKRMPKVGKEMVGPDGKGVVVENNAITEKTKLRMFMEDGTIEVREYPYTDLAKPDENETAVSSNAAPAENGETPAARDAQGADAPHANGSGERAQSARRPRPERPERPEFKRRKEPKKTFEEHLAETEAAAKDENGGTEDQQREQRRNRRRGGRRPDGNKPENAAAENAEAESPAETAEDGTVRAPHKRHHSRRRRSGGAAPAEGGQASGENAPSEGGRTPAGNVPSETENPEK